MIKIALTVKEASLLHSVLDCVKDNLSLEEEFGEYRENYGWVGPE